MEVFVEPFNFSFFNVTGWGIDLDYSDIEWFALERNRDHSVIFESGVPAMWTTLSGEGQLPLE